MNTFNKQRNKYDASYKIAMVEEYLNEKEKYSISQFAINHGMSKSTFHKWVRKFNCNKTKNEEITNTKSNKFIQLSTIAPSLISNDSTSVLYSDPVNINNVTDSIMKLNYKGAILEFDSNNLHQIMNELKQW